jgi:hypothetical protein
MSIEERVARLERGARWWRRVALVCFASLAGVSMLGQAKDEKPPKLDVRALRLVDDAGRVFATLDRHMGGGPILVLNDPDSSAAICVLAGSDGACLSITDAKGKDRVWLDVGDRVGASLRVVDENERARAILGAAVIPHPKTGAETRTDEGALSLLDTKGNVIWQAPR